MMMMMVVVVVLMAGVFACGFIINSLYHHISPIQFLSWLRSIPSTPTHKHASRTNSKAELQKVFAMFDKNSDGFITKQELQDSLNSLGLFTTETDILSMMDRLDVNGDGLLDVDEFFVFYHSMGRKKKILMENQKEEEEDDDDEDEDDLREAFNVFDENHDGLITAEELKSILSCLGLKQGRSVEEARDMISKVDTDGDGMVNFNEFKQMMIISKPHPT